MTHLFYFLLTREICFAANSVVYIDFDCSEKFIEIQIFEDNCCFIFGNVELCVLYLMSHLKIDKFDRLMSVKSISGA